MLITEKQFIQLLNQKKKSRSLTAFAPETGVKYQFLAKVLSGDYHPGPTLAKAMGFEQVVMFKSLPRKKPAAKKAPEKPTQKPVAKKTTAQPAAKAATAAK